MPAAFFFERIESMAQAGGLVTISLAPLNPWVNDETDIAKGVRAAWMRKLDRVAGALAELRDAGVVALFRPMQEMNGNWYWRGMSSHPSDPGPYFRVYRHMRDYFENEKKLNNLLWVYSPNATLGQDSSSSWMRSVGRAYPGNDYVDIVAGTNYDDTVDLARRKGGARKARSFTARAIGAIICRWADSS
jgi:mannan endo-1,4-beta-mannosidase